MKRSTPLYLRASAVLLLLLISGAAGPRPLAAQSPAERRAEAFADSIAPVSDTASLLALETRLMRAARRDRGNPGVHLTLGQLALRLGHYDDAASEFKWATQLEPQWPYPWFGLGIAEFGAGTDKSPGRDTRRAILGRDAWTRAATAWTRAISLEPAFAVRLERLGHAALERGDHDQATVIREALRRAATPPRSTRPAGAVVLARGRFERQLGDTVGALAVFESLTWEDGRAQSLLEQARLRFVMAGGDGSEPYYAGARLDDSIAVPEYRRDLVWVATPAELAEFDRAAGPDRAEFLWSFWTGRDRRDLRVSGDRLREHYRRLELARRQFGADSLDAADPRVAIWIRHGPPDDRITVAIAGVMPNETWRFKRPDHDLVLHFGAPKGGRYSILPTLLDLVRDEPAGRGGASDEEPRIRRTELVHLLRSRAALGPEFHLSVSRGDQVAAFERRDRAMTDVGRQVLLGTDDFELRFRRDLAADVRVLAVGQDARGPAIQVLFAYPAADQALVRRLAGFEFSTRLRLVAWDSLGRLSFVIDTVAATIIPGLPHSGGRLHGRIGLPAVPGVYRLSLAIEGSAGEGMLVEPETVTVEPHLRGMATSDLVVSGDAGGVSWRVPSGDVLTVSPVALFTRRSSAQLYLEVRGLIAADSVKVRAFVRPLTDGPDAEQVKWKPLQGAEAWKAVALVPTSVPELMRIRLPIGLAKLKSGRYEVELVMVDGANRTIRRRSGFVIQ